MIRIQTELTSIETGDLGLQRGERPGGLFGTFRGVPLCGAEPADLGCCCFAAAQRIDLSGQPGQPFAPVSSGTDERRQPVLFTSLSVLAAAPVSCRLLQRALRLELSGQLRLPSGDPGSLAVQLVGVASDEELSRVVLGLPHPLSREERGGDALPQGREEYHVSWATDSLGTPSRTASSATSAARAVASASSSA